VNDVERVAKAAYELWEKDGKPEGKDLEHWFKAEAQLGENVHQENVEATEKKTKRKKDSAC